MPTPIPSKRECFFILKMIETELISFRTICSWADEIIMRLDSAPPWLGDLALSKHRGDQTRALCKYIFSTPFETLPREIEKFHVACLWLRYERGEMFWGTFLLMAGRELDGANGDWGCETPYSYLTLFENADFTEESERETREAYLAEEDLQPWIELAREKFEPFRRLREEASH